MKLKLKLQSVFALITVAVATIATFSFFHAIRNHGVREVGEYLRSEMESRYGAAFLYAAMGDDVSKKGDLARMQDLFQSSRAGVRQAEAVVWLLEGVRCKELGLDREALHATEEALKIWPTHIESYALKVICLRSLHETNKVNDIQEWLTENRERMSYANRDLMDAALGNMVKPTTGTAAREEASPFLRWIAESITNESDATDERSHVSPTTNDT